MNDLDEEEGVGPDLPAREDAEKSSGRLAAFIRFALQSIQELGIPRLWRNNLIKGIGSLISACMDLGVNSLKYKRGKIILEENRVTAESKSYEKLLAAATATEVQEMKKDPQLARAFLYENNAMLRKQKNREDVAMMALEEARHHSEHLLESHPDAQQEISETFLDHLAFCAELTNEDEMKRLWARILTRESAKPGSYSLRTLDVLRTMTRKDADLFTKVAQAVIGDELAFIIPDYEWLIEQFGITYTDLMDLDSMNLVKIASDCKFGAKSEVKEMFRLYFTHFGWLIIIECNNSKPFSMPSIPLTNEGRELLTLCDNNPSIEVVKLFASFFKKGDCKIQFVRNFRRSENRYVYEISELEDIN